MLSMPVLTCPKPHFSWLLPKKKKKKSCNSSFTYLLLFNQCCQLSMTKIGGNLQLSSPPPVVCKDCST